MHPVSPIITGLDPARFMEALGLRPDPWQASLLRGEPQNTLLLCSRQSGKSTVTAALALHAALTRPGSLVLMLAPALRQSQEVYRKLLAFHRAAGNSSGTDARSALGLELANGSRVVSLPGREDTIRGYSGVRLLVVDEAARVPDELYYAVRPMLAVSNGTVMALSTPYGQRGWFHREWTAICADDSSDPLLGVPDPASQFSSASIGVHLRSSAVSIPDVRSHWCRICVPASDCPRIAPAFLDQERRSLGDWWFSQEYDCQFNDTNDQVFATEHIIAALDDTIEPLDLDAI
jgi:terminase large subunit-like protein